ncbi:FMN-binding split barrel-related protein [Pleurostoma richardsiae]|uniref:FMN-binding split barrel-related protein n=1 Tax=Pleurostoma richardsiae TaxID=41990 RepID=A0AA38RQK9_9PEZI|nr:FMN-binding split barrel-related protein [Pleurostoma richardsiae]
MKLTNILLAAAASQGSAAAAVARPPPPPPAGPGLSSRIPTSYESAVLGRRVLALTPLATISTVFPSSSHSDSSDAPEAQERRPAGLDGLPIGLTDYIADCDPSGSGNPTVLAISIATSFRNARAGSNVSLSVQWVPPYPPSKRIQNVPSRPEGERVLLSSQFPDEDTPDSYPFSAANLPRFSLIGYLEPIEPAGPASAAQIAECFVGAHPDARYWLPGNRIHESTWARLVVQQVYWVGGFGDRAYIGWIPAEEWAAVTEEQWKAVRLPGERKGWKEWSVTEEARDL